MSCGVTSSPPSQHRVEFVDALLGDASAARERLHACRRAAFVQPGHGGALRVAVLLPLRLRVFEPIGRGAGVLLAQLRQCVGLTLRDPLLGSFGQVVNNIYRAGEIITPTGLPTATATVTPTPTNTVPPTATSRFSATPAPSNTAVP